MRINGAAFTVWDVGGQDKMRPLWRSYTRATDAIIFVVDSSKADRLEEASLELQRFCKTSVPVLVLANKQDLPGALEAAEVEQRLGLSKLGASDARVQAVCAVTGDGLDEGLGVLQDMIAASKGSRKKNKTRIRAS